MEHSFGNSEAGMCLGGKKDNNKNFVIFCFPKTLNDDVCSYLKLDILALSFAICIGFLGTLSSQL